jgi:hypothetical protein
LDALQRNSGLEPSATVDQRKRSWSRFSRMR